MNAAADHEDLEIAAILAEQRAFFESKVRYFCIQKIVDEESRSIL